jgi:hypothetical protein
MERPRDTEFYRYRARRHCNTVVWDAVAQPVNEARSVELVMGLSEDDYCVLLGRIAHNLTVVARGMIHDAETAKITHQDAIAQIQWLNELMHALTSGFRDSAVGRDGYPRNVLVGVMYERARRGNFESLFSRLCMAPALAGVGKPSSEA